MPRKRKDGDPLGLQGTRLYPRRGRIFYAPKVGGWRMLDTTDLEEAKRIAARYRAAEQEGRALADAGTMAYWLPEWLKDCGARVAAGQLAQRTHDDYTGYCADDGPLLAFFGAMRPERIAPVHVQTYLDENARLDPPRLTQSNREKAALSACMSWLIRTGKVPGLTVNPCMRASGIKRNRETPRERYVTDEEYRAVYAAGDRSVRLAMELVYRTLQRPEVDLLAWTPANVRDREGVKVLRFKQSKTDRAMEIELTGMLGSLVAEAIGPVPVLHQPILHTRKGEPYTYDGLMANVKHAIDRVRREHKARGGPLADMPSFGLRDLKGKGATDMWREGVPIERIQLLCGHADKRTTEVYVKQRWTEAVAPNNRAVG